MNLDRNTFEETYKPVYPTNIYKYTKEPFWDTKSPYIEIVKAMAQIYPLRVMSIVDGGDLIIPGYHTTYKINALNCVVGYLILSTDYTLDQNINY